MANDQRDEILRRASMQLGLFTTAQARTCGLTADAVKQWGRSGAIISAGRGVWGVAGAPDGSERRAMTAVLRHGHDAVLASRSASWLWGLPGHQLDPVDVLRRRGEHLPDAGRARTSRLLTSLDVTERRGIPVTTPVRTIFDLAGRQHHQRTRRDLNKLMAAGLVKLPMLDATLDRLACRGRSGIVVMRELIAEVHSKGAPAASTLELLAEELLELAGFRELERQVDLGDADGFIARVDFADRGRRIAVEVDSDHFHGGLVDRQLDDAKTARLERAGWTVVRITEREIWWDRPALVNRLRQVLWKTRPMAPDPT